MHICIKKQNKNYCPLISAVLILVVTRIKIFYTTVYITTLLQSFPLSPLFVRHTHTQTPTLLTFSHFGPHIRNNLPKDIRHSLCYSLFVQKQTHDIFLLSVFQLSNTVHHPYQSVQCVCVCVCVCVRVHLLHSYA